MERYLRGLERALAIYNLGLSVYGLENVPNTKNLKLKPGRPRGSGDKRTHGKPKAQASFMAEEEIFGYISGIKDIGYDVGDMILSENCRILRIRFKERVETPMAEADFSEHISNALEAAKLQEYAGAIKVKGYKSSNMIKITNKGIKRLNPFMKAYKALLVEHNLDLESE